MIRINLIPREERTAVRSAGPNWMAIAAVVGPVFYAFLLFAVVMVQNHRSVLMDEMIQQEEAAMAHYAPALQKIDTLTREKADVQSRLAALEELDQSRRLPVHLLETVCRSVPRFLWVERMEEVLGDSLEIAIKGNTFSNLIVSDFIERLEESDLFTVVDLDLTKESRIGETKVVEFSLVVRGAPEVPEAREEALAGLPLRAHGG
ncbi:MAG: PilN domain-containing protein [Candidatus Eisenbacteria bacterium]